MAGTVTLEDRYHHALFQVRLQTDVHVFDNYPMCCGSCAGAELEQKHPDEHYVYFMNQQGRGLMFEDGMPYHFEDPDNMKPSRLAQKVYFSHSTIHAATVLRDALVAAGLTVEWNGSEGQCVTLDFAGEND